MDGENVLGAGIQSGNKMINWKGIEYFFFALFFACLLFYAGLMTGLYYATEKTQSNERRLVEVEKNLTDLRGKVIGIETTKKKGGN